MRQQLYKIIFEHDTKAGRRFDVVLLCLILVSVIVVIVESIPLVNQLLFPLFYSVEWAFTILFTIEYILRIWSSPKPLKYIFSFWGLIDLISIAPTYLEFFYTGSHYLLIIRIFRLLRMFRIFRLVRFSSEAAMLFEALKSGSYKISIFLLSVLSIVTLLGTLMYVIEGSENGFTSIPQGIYWAIVTVTTVGFGDIVPQTVMGKFLSSISMMIGYAIIAVPTGIITVELSKSIGLKRQCDLCAADNPAKAKYCNQCGAEMKEST